MDAAIALAARIPAARLGGAVEIRPAEKYGDQVFALETMNLRSIGYTKGRDEDQMTSVHVDD